MDTFLLYDNRNNVNYWEVPVLYGEGGEILGAEVEKKDTDPSTALDHPSRESAIDHQSKFLKDEEQIRTIGLQKVKRETLPVLHVKGSFYEVGHKIGRTFSSIIHDYIDNNRNVQLSLKLYETAKGKDVYNSCFDAVSRTYPEYLRELRGVAEGSKVPFYKLFLMHMEDIMLVALPSNQERPPPLTASTTIIVSEPDSQYVGHVVDQASIALGNVYLVCAIITETAPEQEFTALCIGGMLPGNSVAYNAQGVVFVVDPVYVRKCNECGIPRSIICRAALSAANLSKLSIILQSRGTGIGNGMSLTVSSHHLRVLVRSFECYEAGPKFPPHSDSSIAHFTIRHPKDTHYYHLNKFQFLKTVQENIEKVYSRWMVSKLKTLKTLGTQVLSTDLPKVLGDSSLNTLDLTNIYTSVESRGMLTVAVGIIDFISETWSLYLDNPAETDPIIVIPLVTKEYGLARSP